MRERFTRSATAALLSACFIAASSLPAPAQTQAGTVAGTVVDRNGSLPVANAYVELDQSSQKISGTKTDQTGRYSFAIAKAGFYSISIAAQGYQRARSEEFVVTGNKETVNVDVTLVRAQGTPGLAEIGSVSATRGALQASTVITSDLSAARLERENYVRVGDALNTLPGVNLRGQSSAVGDDLSVDIRGLKPSETQTLLDGHPIGPLGAFAGSGGGFNYQDSPYFALGNVQVTFGSGALGLYGTDSIGGTVDLQTLNPTRVPHFTATQGFGSQNKLFTSLQATGIQRRLGYALVHAVQGTWGDFAPQLVTQRGLVGNDLTSATANSTTFVNGAPPNTYTVTGGYLLHNDLGKVTYQLSNATALMLTGYSAISWDDKSGNGDTDFQTYEQQVFNGQQIADAGGMQNLPNGNTLTCPAGLVAVLNDQNPVNGTCVSVATYAAGSSGPAGGGPAPFQYIRNQDYHARLSTQLRPNNTLFLDGFIDQYSLDYNRFFSSQDSAGKFNGGFHSNFYHTTGFLIGDDIASEKNDLGFGYYVEHQRINSDSFDTSAEVINQGREYGLGYGNIFVRDAFTPTPQLSLFANAWFKKSNVTGLSTFDPRVSVIFRPSSHDVLRVTGGKADGEPAPQLRYGPINFNNTPTNINPGNCQKFTVGNTSNASLKPESATDFEVAYGHRFEQDSNIQLTYYATNETNALFSGAIPLKQIGITVPAALLGVVNGPQSTYLGRISAICPTLIPILQSDPYSILQSQTAYNAANGRYQGLEISGRYRFAPQFYVDATYDVQSAQYQDVPDSILKNNPTIINGSQILGIPMHKASVGFDYNDTHGFEARLDGFYIGANNALYRPAYTYFNTALTKELSRNTQINFGVFNLFNDITDNYGRIGLGTYQAENQFGTDTSALAQGSERFGLTPRSFLFTVTQRIR